MSIARTYGVGSLAIKVEGDDDATPLDLWKLDTPKVGFSVFDPLNTSGSLVNYQQPNDPQFQRPQSIRVAGQKYHPSRSRIIMNEDPIYLEWSEAGFGYVGRSVFTRGLFPLKSFLQTMTTDDMVSRKAGLIIAKINQQGGIVNNVMRYIAGLKRDLLKEGETENILSIGTDEAIESLNLQNIDASAKGARDNILKNIAIACEVHAKILADEAFVEGFGEGSEDANNIAMCLETVREDMAPIYAFLDPIVMHCAWTPEFYKTVQEQFPDSYASKDYQTAFYEWSNSFNAVWPPIRKEPESEQIKVKELKFRAAAAVLQILAPRVGPEQEAQLIEWFLDCINQEELLFPAPIELDIEAVIENLVEEKAKREEMQEQESEREDELGEKAPKAWAKMDGIAELESAVARLPDRRRRPRESA